MAWYTYGTVAVYDAGPGASDRLVTNATGGKFVLVKDGTAQPIQDLNGTPITEITSNGDGQSSQFQAQSRRGLVQFGNLVVTVWANEVADELDTFDDSLAAANSAASSASSSASSAAASATAAAASAASAGGGGGTGGGVTDHGALSGLADDDHPQYLNNTRGDARYYTQAQVDAKDTAAASLNSAADRNRANHSGTQIASSISDFTTAVQAVPGFGSGGGTAGVVNDPASTSTTLALSAAAAKTVVSRQGPTVMVASYGSAGTSGYTSIQTPTDADSATVINNKLASNLAILQAAVVDAAGRTVDGGPDPIYVNGELNYPTGHLKLNLGHWRGSTAQSRPIKPALRILNLFGSEMVMDIGTYQVGPTNPVANITTQYALTMGQLVAPGGTGIDNQGGYRNIKSADCGEVYCKDPVPFAAETGLVNTSSAATWRAELMSVHGIGVNVSSVNLATAGTAVGGYPYSSLERHTIQGAASGVTAVANSWAIDSAGGSTGKLIFASVSGDFRNGENLVDVTGGASNVIGVAGQMFVAFAGRALFDYNLSTRMAVANAVTPGTWTTTQISDARPRFRLMNKARVSLDLTVKASHDVDTFLTTTERNIPAVELDGLYCPKVKVVGLSGYSRLLMIRSCEAPDIYEMDATGIANHAIGSSSPNFEEAYGYGVELQGVTRFAKFRDSKGRFLRHLFTTNPNSRTWGTVAADGVPDYMGMGVGSMWAEVYNNTATECFSAAFDTHEGAWGTRWRNNDVFRPASGSRVVTVPAGYNSRGFADDYEDCRVDGGASGFSNGGIALTSGIPYTTVYRDVKAKDVQVSALTFSDFQTGLRQDQSGLLASQQSAQIMFATVVMDNPDVLMDNTVPTAHLQFAIVCGVGQFEWRGGGKIAGFNRSPVRIKAGGVHTFFEPPMADYSQSITGANPLGFQLDGTSYIEMLDAGKIIQRSGTVPPSFWNDVSGSSVIRWKDFDYSLGGLTSTSSGPGTKTAAKSGAGGATLTDTRPATGSGGHSTAVAPTLTINPGPTGTAGTGATATLTTGSTDLAGEIVVTAGTTPVAGAVVKLTFGTAFGTSAFPAIVASTQTIGVGAQTKSPYVFQPSKTDFTIAAAALNAGESRFTYVVNGT